MEIKLVLILQMEKNPAQRTTKVSAISDILIFISDQSALLKIIDLKHLSHKRKQVKKQKSNKNYRRTFK